MVGGDKRARPNGLAITIYHSTSFSRGQKELCHEPGGGFQYFNQLCFAEKLEGNVLIYLRQQCFV